MDQPLQTVVETTEFLTRAAKLMTDEQREEVVKMLAREPECGEIIRGTGGARKVRVALAGRGKSGGAGHLLFSQRSASHFRSDRVREERKIRCDTCPAERAGRSREGHQAAVGKVNIMSKKAFDSIMAGLTDALAYTKGDKTRGRVTTVDVRDLDVGKVRGKVGLSQNEFARIFGVSIGTLRNWEQKRVRPDGPARVLLTVIDRDPVSVLKALRIGPKRAGVRRRRAA